MTNYEKIKAMSVEKMTDFFDDAENNIILPPCSRKYCEKFGKTVCGSDSEACKAATKHWLESEVEENDNETV